MIIGKKSHADMCALVLYALKHDDLITHSEIFAITPNRDTPLDMLKMNLFTRIGKGVYQLNREFVAQVSYLAPQSYFDEIEARWAKGREQKKAKWAEVVARRQAARAALITPQEEFISTTEVLTANINKKVGRDGYVTDGNC